MQLEQLFNDCTQREVEQRTKEEQKKNKQHQLRCQWVSENIEKLSFLKDKGIRLQAHYGSEFPFIAIKPQNGWAFIDVDTMHVWEEKDLEDETYYVCSNTEAFAPKTRVGWDKIFEVIAKWI